MELHDLRGLLGFAIREVRALGAVDVEIEETWGEMPPVRVEHRDAPASSYIAHRGDPPPQDETVARADLARGDELSSPDQEVGHGLPPG
jgi:hypothetical protein